MTVRVGVIGTGMMGADHVATLARHVPGTRVTALSDPDRDRAEAVAAGSGVAGVTTFDDAAGLIASPDVDAVLIASPDDTHEDLVVACIDAGKPVLCEKPLAATAAGCLRVVEREVSAGRRLVQLGYMRRFDPAYRELKRALDTGQVGRALLLHCVHRNASALPYFTSAMPILNSAVHEIDIARWLLATEITRVSVFTPRSTGSATAELIDPRLLILETAAGVTVDVEVFVNARYGYDVRCELVGETGTISLAPPAKTTLRQNGIEGVPVSDDFRTRFADAYREQLRAWVEAVATKDPAGPSAWDGYAASRTAEACLTAAAEHRAVDVTLPDQPELYRT